MRLAGNLASVDDSIAFLRDVVFFQKFGTIKKPTLMIKVTCKFFK